MCFTEQRSKSHGYVLTVIAFQKDTAERALNLRRKEDKQGRQTKIEKEKKHQSFLLYAGDI